MRVLDESGYVEAYFAGAYSGFVKGVSERTRRALGSWPTPESLVDQLVRLLAEAADREPDKERKKKLRDIAEGIGGAGRAVAIDLFAAFLRQQAGLP